MDPGSYFKVLSVINFNEYATVIDFGTRISTISTQLYRCTIFHYISCTIDSINSRYDFVSRLFTYEEIRRLEQLSFYDMLMCITKMEWNDIPRNPFRVPTTGKGETICGNVNLFNSS